MAELSRLGGELDAFIKVIIVERIVKATVLTVLAIGPLVAGNQGWLDPWADFAENQLNLNVRSGIIMQLLLRVVEYVGDFNQITLLAISALAYAGRKELRASGSPCADAGRNT